MIKGSIFLKSGELKLSQTDVEFTTLVGSCVSVCLHDSVLKIGGMNHFLVPTKTETSFSPNILNYGDKSLLTLLKEFKKNGSDPKNIKAYIIGGASIGNVFSLDIGQKNIQIARQFLKRFEIKIAGQSVGGTVGKKIRFFPTLGEVYIQAMQPKVINTILAIGTSTGGTETLKEILEPLPESMPPILVVQHMPENFTSRFASRLNEICRVRVKEAQDHEIIQSGYVYIAPGGRQMKLVYDSEKNYRIRLTMDPIENRFRTSVDYLFRSLVPIAAQINVQAYLLTGMGDDGARELLNLRLNGAKTIAQSEDSSIVYGMPKAAMDIGAAEYSMDVLNIQQDLIRSVLKAG